MYFGAERLSSIGGIRFTDFRFLLKNGDLTPPTMTRRTKQILEVAPEELLEISAEDAKKLKIKNGEMVKVSSRRGEINVRAKITCRSQKGNVFLSFHYPEALSNLLTSEHRDPITGTPEYKACAVKVEK